MGRTERFNDFAASPAEGFSGISGPISIFEAWHQQENPSNTLAMKDIPPEELDVLLANFFQTIKTRDGQEYTIHSLNTLRSGIDRSLKECGYPISITKSSRFYRSRAAFSENRERLRRLGASKLLDDMRNVGSSTPTSLLNLIFYTNVSHFASVLTKHSDHYILKWGQIQLHKTTEGREYIELSCRPRGKVNPATTTEANIITCKAFENPTEPQICPVRLWKEYRDKRPSVSLNPGSCFYLRPITTSANVDKTWFKPEGLGANAVSEIVSMVKDIKT